VLPVAKKPKKPKKGLQGGAAWLRSTGKRSILVPVDPAVYDAVRKAAGPRNLASWCAAGIEVAGGPTR
jgi:hypothetical protein